MLYALDREPLPSLNLKWRTPAQIRVVLDNCLPLGACHHQKLVVVDGTLAFCGGLDLTVRRWDTSEHRLDQPRRVDPDGESYPPFHDLQMAVDGDAAGALLEIARHRWEAAGGEALVIPHAAALWPEGVDPDFENVEVGIARTGPSGDGARVVQEVRDLYLAAIGAANRHIYIENQYLTDDGLAEAMVARLEQVPGLEVVAVTPRLPHGWLEAQTMGAAQEVFMEQVTRGELSNRVRFLYPWVGREEKQPVMVHAKLMIVDDRLIRVGSSNMNRRSMGVDSECDLAIEGVDPKDRRTIRSLLCRQLGEHLGVPEAAVAE
jgi:phosphatidylserine/phosphatidylglycerophosphate/cardiolipin synthase-like enzyme